MGAEGGGGLGFDEEAVAGVFFAPNENEILAGGAVGGGGGADIEIGGERLDGKERREDWKAVEGQLESSSFSLPFSPRTATRRFFRASSKFEISPFFSSSVPSPFKL